MKFSLSWRACLIVVVIVAWAYALMPLQDKNFWDVLDSKIDQSKI